MSEEDAKAIAARFVEAFSTADAERMGDLLDDDLIAFVTNAEGGTDRVEGSAALLARIEAMGLASARFSVELTQPPVPVPPDRVLAMVEVHAERDGRTLENFAAHLLQIRDGRIAEWRMVDAKPAESDEFWAA